MTAFRSLASWRGDGPFGAWLTRIGVRIALRQAGSRRKVVPWRDPTRADVPTEGSPMRRRPRRRARGTERRAADRPRDAVAPR